MNQALQTDIRTAAREHAYALLREYLTPDHRYHDLAHTERVVEAALSLGRMEGLEEDELEILELAALFHDTGFTKTYEGHEAISCQIATEFLQSQGYPEDRRDQVSRLIDATFPPKQPESLMEQIICDADLSNLGSERYEEGLANLRHEWETFLNQSYTDEAWYSLNYKFVKNYHYRTVAAQAAYHEQWKANKNALKLKRNELRAAEQGPLQAYGSFISNNKSAQTMFKTSLRNHLDLSALADNKANIMLSVNALIITIAMPMSAAYVKGNVYAIIPLGMLLITCLTSMVFATLATRPIKMSGQTPSKDIKEGRSNLFFFGNFYGMGYEKYERGMLETVADDKKLDSAIMRDLYYLGSSLGKKYKQLRTCYTIFMWGVIATVVVFGIAYSMSL